MATGDQKPIFKWIGAIILILSLFIITCPKYNHGWSLVCAYIIVGIIFMFHDRIYEIKIFNIFSAKLKDKINEADKLTKSLYSLEKISTKLAIDNLIKDMTVVSLELSGGGSSQYIQSTEKTLLEIIESTSLHPKDTVQIIIDPIINTLIFNQFKTLRNSLDNRQDKININDIIYDNFSELSIRKYTPDDINRFIDKVGKNNNLEDFNDILSENNNEDKMKKFSHYLSNYK